jgi:hypothetical protein
MSEIFSLEGLLMIQRSGNCWAQGTGGMVKIFSAVSEDVIGHILGYIGKNLH